MLADFEECEPMQWIIGTHGIQISFQFEGKSHNATYLPDVALEQGWDHVETLTSLVEKALGYNVQLPLVMNTLTVVRYQTSKASLTYQQFLSKQSP